MKKIKWLWHPKQTNEKHPETETTLILLLQNEWWLQTKHKLIIAIIIIITITMFNPLF